MNYKLTSAEQLVTLCAEQGCGIGEIMVRREMELAECSRDEVEQKLQRAWTIMREAAELALTHPQRSMGGLIGGEAKALKTLADAGKSICGGAVSRAAAYALGTLEVNASMGLIVAAPTAGSSGVLPGVLLALQEQQGFREETMLDALACAGAIGMIIARNATIAGAEGGCQAEVGAASAMAAAAAVQLMGGSPAQSCAAAASAISNLLGLVCDPIRGLVEAPCQGRNAMGAVNAMLCAELSLAGAVPNIPLDEVIAAMYAVGKSLPSELRETAMGGIAACPSAMSGACAGCK
ncbi:MAG: L-serine ammonia-lyase, iron-sulfur-dependent, subunit alpha [Angelakisella sp.]